MLVINVHIRLNSLQYFVLNVFAVRTIQNSS